MTVMRRASWLTFMAAIGFGALLPIVGDSLAQEKREPPPRKPGIATDTAAPDARLPKIDLPEFVITGKETIDLPQFSKESTEPRLEDALLARNDIAGAREEIVGTSSGVSREATFSPGANVLDGKASLGYGTYRTPFFDGWFGQTHGVSGFLLKAGYASSGGHVAHADYRKGYTSLSGTSMIPEGIDVIGSARVQGNLGLDGHTYNLYGSATPDLERTVGHLSLGLSVQAAASDLFEYGVRASVQTASQEDKTSARESAVGMDLVGSRTLQGIDLRVHASLWTDGYSAPVPTENPYFVEFGLAARQQFSSIWDVSGGVVLYSYRGSDTDGMVKFYPTVRALMHPTPSLTLFAAFEPKVSRVGLSSMVQKNPYLTNTLRIRHHDCSVEASLGAEASVGRALRARLELSFERVHNMPLYVDPGAAGVWSVDYFGVTDMTSFEAEIYADLTEYDQAAGSIAARSVRNSVTTKSIPYAPSFELSGLYQHRFPIGVTLGTTMRVVGQRYVDLQGSRSLDPVTLIDVRGDYTVVRNLTASLMLNNLFNKGQTWWDGYAGVGRTVSCKLALTW